MEHIWTIRILAIALIIAGLAIRYFISRRKFNRRAMTGLEGFRSYERAWSITLVERIMRWVGFLLIIVGLLVFISTIMNAGFLYD